ncbi:MAG: hypothetical protein LAT63_07975 [Marinobacter sp.]|nr:hypothetical protein [Marinobacter sp.]
MSCIAKTSLLAAGIACGLLLSGCATGPKVYDRATLTAADSQWLAQQPAQLQPAFRNLLEEGQRNRVLNLMDIGVTAYRAGYREEALRALDTARLEIESVFADNEGARRARSLWYEEAEKDFKGEPYERAMVYFYLGLIHLENGDYGNARASFLGGLLQDAFAEEEQYSADFALMIYLAGWAALQMGEPRLAAEHFEELKVFRPDAPIPGPEHNALLVVETGNSPRKLGDGVGHYQLVFRRGRGFSDVAAQWRSNGDWQSVYPVEDIFFQASTRGGRAIDRIIAGQVQFAETTRNLGSNLSEVSQSSILAGASMSAGGAFAGGFAAISLVSVAAQGMSAATNTRVDTRYWNSLPDTVHVMPVTAQPGQQVDVRFLDRNGQPIPGMTDTTTFNFDHRGRGLAFATSQRPN